MVMAMKIARMSVVTIAMMNEMSAVMVAMMTATKTARPTWVTLQDTTNWCESIAAQPGVLSLAGFLRLPQAGSQLRLGNARTIASMRAGNSFSLWMKRYLRPTHGVSEATMVMQMYWGRRRAGFLANSAR